MSPMFVFIICGVRRYAARTCLQTPVVSATASGS